MKNLSLFILLFLHLALTAQKITISGTITDESQTPLPGVQIIELGTTNGTQTDFDGHYKIEIKKGGILQVNYIGFTTVEKRFKNSIIFNLALEVSKENLEEVVIVGYESYNQKKSRKSELTPNTNQYFVAPPIPNMDRVLAGKAAGLTTSYHSVLPTSHNSIKIRGQASIDGKQPLFIVDGMPLNAKETLRIKQIPESQIKEISRLDAASAMAIYGSQAVHGCIVINTHHGRFDLSDEVYREVTENQFESTQLNPLSTFSIDVDKAGYSNIRRMINAGQGIPKEAVKIEEMVNYFDYLYPQPTQHPFSITTQVAMAPWNENHQLVRIGLQGKSYQNQELPPSNLTFLIDVSGSMSSPNKLPLLKSAFKLLVNQLRAEDKVSIVVYAGAAGMVLSPTSGSNKKTILNALNQLEAGGSTAGGAGIKLAYQLAEKNFKKNGNNRVIIATDGDFNVGESSDKAMQSLIEAKRESGIYLSVLGFGMGNYKDSKLETLADNGNGNYAYIDNLQEARKVFGKEFGGTLYTIAKDVKIQIEFNPILIQAYRLIGYENRLLADADFVDDTKDAGELGSGHQVTALYEVIPTGIQSSYLENIPELKYTQKSVQYSNSNELATVKFRYKEPEGEKSKEIVQTILNTCQPMSVDFKFAASVALFGKLLKDSKFIQKGNYEMVQNLAEQGRGVDTEGYRAEFLRLVKSIAKSL